jgi:hypothetical protein
MVVEKSESKHWHRARPEIRRARARQCDHDAAIDQDVDPRTENASVRVFANGERRMLEQQMVPTAAGNAVTVSGSGPSSISNLARAFPPSFLGSMRYFLPLT